MGILVSPLIAPLLGGILDTPVELARLLRFPAGPVRRGDLQHGEVDAGNAPEGAPRTKLLASYKTLFGTGAPLTAIC